MANDAGFLLGGEFSLGGSKFVRVQATRFGKNWRTCLGEQMVADGMTRWRSCKTVRGEDILELFQQLLDLLRSRQKSNAPKSWLRTFRSSEDDRLAVSIDHTMALDVEEKIELL